MGNGRRRQRRRLWLAQNKLCPWCGNPITVAEMASPELTDRDHVVPKSHGGEGRLWNLQLLHRRCNMEKGDRCPGCDWPGCNGPAYSIRTPEMTGDGSP